MSCRVFFTHRLAAVALVLTLDHPAVAQPTILPLEDYQVTGYGFSAETPNGRHLGEDVLATPCTPVRAVSNGVIVLSRKDRQGYGQYVVISHEKPTSFVSVYGHLSKRAECPLRGTGPVKQGDIIGHVGYEDEMGTNSTHPHLHFAIHLKAYSGSYRYWGYAPNKDGEDVDVDAAGVTIGGLFTNPTVFISSNVQTNEPPVAKFEASHRGQTATNGGAPLVVAVDRTGQARVRFADRSTDIDGRVVSRIWRVHTEDAPISIGDSVFTWGFTPGIYTVTLTIADDDGVTSESVGSIDVREDSGTLAARDDSYLMVRGGTLSLSAPGVVENDSIQLSQVPGMSVEFLDAPAGMFVDESGGVFRFRPSLDASSPIVFRYIIRTTLGESNPATVTIALAAEPKLTVLTSMSSERGQGSAPLIKGSDDWLYGTTETGGSAGVGTVFRVSLAGQFETVHSFDGTMGAGPREVSLGADGWMYGTSLGGDGGYVFRVQPDGRFEIVHSFARDPSYGSQHPDPLFPTGRTPVGGLTHLAGGGMLGVTAFGGKFKGGTLYRIGPGGSFELLHEFDGTVRNPSTALVVGPDGAFYGGAGSQSNTETIYRFTVEDGLTTVYALRAFDGSTGTYPDGGGIAARLLSASDGNLYGVATHGGKYGRGVIFRVSVSGSYRVMHDFDWDTTGAKPHAALIEAPDGIYGTAAVGGRYWNLLNSNGTIFRMSWTGDLEVLHHFRDVDGDSSHGALLRLPDGMFYGTTFNGGATDHGVVFRLALP